MERGPLALFGAIVAVGLGPALWLGAQFGSIQIAPTGPPSVSEQRPAPEQLLGGAGAGDNPIGTDDPVIGSTPQGGVKQITTVPTTRHTTRPAPTRTTEAPEPEPSETTTTAGPGPSTPADDGPSTPPADDETDDPSVPPEPPAGEDDPTDPADPGEGAGVGEAG